MTTNTNDKLTACLEMIVSELDTNEYLATLCKSPRDVLCSVYDYATMSTNVKDYTPEYFQAMESVINIIEGPTTSLDMHTLAIRVDDLLAFIDTNGDNFND